MKSRIRDLTGQTFGRLTVVKFHATNNPRKRASWLCKCECGNKKIVLGYNLISGASNSCGCLHKEQLANRNKANTKHGLWVGYEKADYSSGDLNRWYNHSLTPNEYNELCSQQNFKCAVCGAKPETLYVDHDHKHCRGRKSCSSCRRGLLCSYCNAGLGSFKDNIEFLKNAVTYLEKFNVS